MNEPSDVIILDQKFEHLNKKIIELTKKKSDSFDLATSSINATFNQKQVENKLISGKEAFLSSISQTKNKQLARITEFYNGIIYTLSSSSHSSKIRAIKGYFKYINGKYLIHGEKLKIKKRLVRFLPNEKSPFDGDLYGTIRLTEMIDYYKFFKYVHLINGNKLHFDSTKLSVFDSIIDFVNLSNNRLIFFIKHDSGVLEVIITDRYFARIHTCIMNDGFINGTQVFKYYNDKVYIFYARFNSFSDKSVVYYARIYDSKLDLVKKKALSCEYNFKSILFSNQEICFHASFCLGFYNCSDLSYKRSKMNLDVFTPINIMFKLIHFDAFKFYFYDSTMSKHLRIYKRSSGDLLHLLDFNFNEYVNQIFFDDYSYIYVYNPVEIQAFDSNGKSMFRNGNKVDFIIRNLNVNLEKRIVLNFNKDNSCMRFEYCLV